MIKVVFVNCMRMTLNYTVLQTKADYYSLQCKLNQLIEWSERWQLTISYNKCNTMYVGNTNCKLSMSLNSNTLPVVNEVKDIGVFVDSNLTFHSHIDNIVALAFIRSNLILKCFVLRDVATLMRGIGVCFVRLVPISDRANQANCMCSKKFHQTAAISYMY